MTRKDFVEICTWAVASAVIAVGLAIGHAAVGDGGAKRPTGPVFVVDGLRITVNATSSEADRQRVTLDVTVENPTEKPIALGSKAAVVRQEYYGNPMSRAVVPGDFKRVTIPSKQLSGFYPPRSTRTIHLTDMLPAAADVTAVRNPVVEIASAGGAASRTSARMPHKPTITYGIAVLNTSGRPLSVAGVRLGITR